MSHIADLISPDFDITHLGWGIRAGILPLIQLVPALHQFDDHGVAEIDKLKACDIGSAMHETLQVDVLKTLQGQHGKEWSWAVFSDSRKKQHLNKIIYTLLRAVEGTDDLISVHLS